MIKSSQKRLTLLNYKVFFENNWLLLRVTVCLCFMFSIAQSFGTGHFFCPCFAVVGTLAQLKYGHEIEVEEPPGVK
ncbi:MAG: hypothetical protein ACI9R3_003061 [Verrucomicrobiales bacterium]|jgi:hypothetical protein